MEKTKKVKTFDAVKMMRSARDKISAGIEDMTLEEELKWISLQELHDPFLNRLRDLAAKRADAAAAEPVIRR